MVPRLSPKQQVRTKTPPRISRCRVSSLTLTGPPSRARNLLSPEVHELRSKNGREPGVPFVRHLFMYLQLALATANPACVGLLWHALIGPPGRVYPFQSVARLSE
jgi:hypothetical protein